MKRAKVFVLIVLLIVLVVVQVHLTLFTADNPFNPISLMLLLYYSASYYEKYLPFYPELLTFTVQSGITIFMVYRLFRSVDLRKWVISYFISCVLFLLGCHLYDTNYQAYDETISNLTISEHYYHVYGYIQAFSWVLGYSAMQIVLMLVWFLIYLIWKMVSSISNSRKSVH